MTFLGLCKSSGDDGIPYEKISLWITRATWDAAIRIYEGFEIGRFLAKQELEVIYLPLCSEIASFYASGCIAVVMDERGMCGTENYEKVEFRLFEEILKLGQYYSTVKKMPEAKICKVVLVSPSTRGRTLAYSENDPVKLAVSNDDINRYANKYRPQIRNLPTEQAKVACFLVRLLKVADVERISYETGQKLAELLIFNTVFDEVKGAIALQNAVTHLLREK